MSSSRNKTGYATVTLSRIDPDRVCDVCQGPILQASKYGVCGTTIKCRKEKNSRRRNENRRKNGPRSNSNRICSVCGGPLSRDNKVGICQKQPKCKLEARKEHDRRYAEVHKDDIAARNANTAGKRVNSNGKRIRAASNGRETELLPEDGIVDETAIHIAVLGLRKIAMTHRERLEAVRRMLIQGDGIRDMSDKLHVQPAVVRKILDDLGYECVRNEHIVGSKIMVILPKDRIKGAKILEPVVKSQKPGRKGGDSR